MKCKYCGGDVTLDDHFCPHCGRPVDQAQRHQEEMREYETEFEETKQEAMNKLAVNSGGGRAVGIRLGLIVALIIALVWMAVNLDGYTIHEKREKKAANKNYDSYVEQIEQYISDRDYMDLVTFEDRHRLSGNDKFEEYRYIFYAAGDYRNVYKALLETAYIKEDTRSLYYAENMSEYVNRFYETILNDYYKSGEGDTDRTKKVYDEMEEDLAVLMQKYLHLSKEDTDSMRELSKSRRKILIEEALDNKVVSVTGVGLSEMKSTELPAIGSTKEEQQ